MRRLAVLVVLVFAVSSCVVDEPVISTTAVTAPTSAAAAATPDSPVFEPTSTPLPAATAIPAATATETPAPTPTEPPDVEPGLVAIPTVEPSADALPTEIPAGPLAVPVAGATTFILDQPRPVLQFPGHTLIYLDDSRLAEVDIFTPAATSTGAILDSYSSVIAQVLGDPVLTQVEEQDPVSIGGFPARVFAGTVAEPQRTFFTSLDHRDGDAGWYAPSELRMWVIDAPTAPVIVSAESFDAALFQDAVRLATDVLSTIAFT